MPYTHTQSRGSEIFPREGNRSLNRTFGSVLVHAISPSRHPHRIGFFSIKNASYEGNKFRDDRPSLQAEPQFKTTLYNQVTYSRNKSYAVSPLDVSKTKRLGSAAPGGRQKKQVPAALVDRRIRFFRNAEIQNPPPLQQRDTGSSSLASLHAS